jgi:hypothetical protein
MAFGGLFPESPMKLIGIFIIILVALAVVNNVTFLTDLTRRR